MVTRQQDGDSAGASIRSMWHTGQCRWHKSPPPSWPIILRLIRPAPVFPEWTFRRAITKWCSKSLQPTGTGRRASHSNAVRAHLPLNPSPTTYRKETTHGTDEAICKRERHDQRHDQSCRRDGIGCRRIWAFAGGKRIRIDNARGCCPAIRHQQLDRAPLRSWRRGDGRRQPRHLPFVRQGARHWRLAGGLGRPLRWMPRLPRVPWLRLAWLQVRWMPGLWRLLPVLGTVPLVLILPA